MADPNDQEEQQGDFADSGDDWWEPMPTCAHIEYLTETGGRMSVHVQFAHGKGPEAMTKEHWDKLEEIANEVRRRVEQEYEEQRAARIAAGVDPAVIDAEEEAEAEDDDDLWDDLGEEDEEEDEFDYAGMEGDIEDYLTTDPDNLRAHGQRELDL